MTTFSVSIDEFQLLKVRAGIKVMPRETRIAIVRSINHVIGKKRGGVKKVIAAEIHKVVNVAKSFIYKQDGKVTERTFYDKKASLHDLSGWVRTRGANVPLIYYSNQRGNRKRRSKSISVQVQRKRKRTKLKHAFIPPLRSGHRGLFVRSYPYDTTSRAIRQLYGSRIPDILSNQPVMDKVLKTADEILYRNLDHELTFMMKKAFF